MTMSSSTKTGTIAAMTRISTLMRFEQMRWCMRDGVSLRLHFVSDAMHEGPAQYSLYRS